MRSWFREISISEMRIEVRKGVFGHSGTKISRLVVLARWQDVPIPCELCEPLMPLLTPVPRFVTSSNSTIARFPNLSLLPICEVKDEAVRVSDIYI